MRRGAAPDLGWVDSCIERARIATARRLASPWFRRLVKGKERFRPPRRLSRRDAFLKMRELGDDRARRRRYEARTTLEGSTWRDVEQLRRLIDDGYLWAETRAATEVLHALVRDSMAAALDRLASSPAATQEPSYYRSRADRLRKARQHGTWGYHRQNREWKMFFDSRSGLVRFDASEARRDQARQIRRLLPELKEHARRGCLIYSGVFTEPNAPPGQLAAAKRGIQQRFRQAILGFNAGGSRARAGGAFPEIVGAYTIQEDPLSARGDWNVHLNALLVVDPKLCTPLDPELELVFPPGPRPRSKRGLLCYRKLRYVWGRQLRLRKIEARSDEALERSLLEAIKYPAKWISSKQLDAGGLRPVRPDESPSDFQSPDAHGRLRPGAIDPDLLHRDTGRAHPAGAREDHPPPGIVDWPEARLAEWIDANQRFRRARGFGCLYRLGKDPLPELDERDYRIIGEVTITPRGALVTVTHAETPKSPPVNLIHGDKSGRDFSFQPARSTGARAREGPDYAA